MAGRNDHGWLTGSILNVCRLWIVMWLLSGSSITAMRQTGLLNAFVMNDTARSFIFCTKASRSDTSTATVALFAPRVWPIFVVVLTKVASLRSYSTHYILVVVAHIQAKYVFIESSHPFHVRDRIDGEAD